MSRAELLQKERVEAAGYQLDVRCSFAATDRPHVLLLHGIGVSGDYFLPLAKIMAQRYNLHVFDLPGYGKTPQLDHALSPAELAEVAAAYLSAANIPSAIIIGQSMGCQIAARLAATHPDLCEKLILIAPTVNKWERNLFMQASRLLQDGFFEPLRVNLLVFRDYLRMGFISYLKTTRLMMNDRIEQYIHNIQTRTLIIRGTNDKIVPRRWARYLASKIPDATVAEITDGPHVVQFTKPAEVWQVCEDFLKR